MIRRELLILLVVFSHLSNAKNNGTTENLCKLESGLSSVIVDIEESLGEEIGQSTSPKELPIIGDPWNEIDLTLVQSEKYFRLHGKKLQLSQPLDRDLGDISSIVFQAVCRIKSTNNSRTIPIIVRVSDHNDNAPQFLSTPYKVSIPESTPVGATIFRGIQAKDIDAGVNGLVEYSIINNEEISKEQNGFGIFTINPHQGVITLNRSLDYEKNSKYYVSVQASDRAFDSGNRKSSVTLLEIEILDDDDLGPAFKTNFYNATVVRSVLTGVLDVFPGKIEAKDQDSINSRINYSFYNGTPTSYLNYFLIDSNSGIVRQIRPIENDYESRFELVVKAEENSKRFALARLDIFVHALNSHPPVIKASSLEGIVFENSAVGTVVESVHNGMPIQFVVVDGDVSANDPRPRYEFELTSGGFKVRDDGVLVVADTHLDREAVGVLNFQMIAREISSNSPSSAPLQLKIHLKDKNDNSPKLRQVPPLTIPGGGDGRRFIHRIEADDKDEGVNARVSYSLTHISNNGSSRFKINETTGFLESVGKFREGEQFSITVQATDGGNRMDQSIIEITVVDGPNLKPPVFSQLAYDVTVSEGASIGSEVITLEAVDPEGKSVVYEIVGGNELGHFAIGINTGVVTVNGALDREDLSRYQISVKATDGELSSFCSLNIRLGDINDANPTFTSLPYKFTAKEGQSNKLIGQLSAKDADEGSNAQITFEIPENSNFKIDKQTGQVFTRTALDYERQKIHYVTVTARDNGKNPRIATATMTIVVEDVADESPIFSQFVYEVNVPENEPSFRVAKVEAIDRDSEVKITYYIKQGRFDLFKIDALSGELFTTVGLDYEMGNKHVLVIGTEENDGVDVGSTTTVVVNVLDRNDVPPIFSIVPRPIRIEDVSPIGMVLTKLEATDGDGTSPFNKVKYELVGRGKGGRYFEIDHESGVITLKDDLRKEMDSEYVLDVRAYDLADPPLYSIASVKVNVDHVATVAPEVGVGFSEINQIVHVKESEVGSALLKTLVIINKGEEIIPLDCKIINGNGEGLFKIELNSDRNCDLKLTRASLDHEKRNKYEIQVELITLPGVISRKNSKATVEIHVIDENDEVPVFIWPESQKIARGKKFYAGISQDAQIQTPVTTIRAEDKDSGDFKEISYDIEAENELARSYFGIDAKSGSVFNTKLVDDVSGTLLPFRLNVIARDNPKEDYSKSRFSQVPLVINVIDEVHRMVLVIQGTTPDKVKAKERDILEILQDSSNLLINIEKIASHTFISEDGKIQHDSSATDVWFYAVDPISDHILDREHPKVAESILGRESSKGISYYVSSALGVRATEVRKPISKPVVQPPVAHFESEQQWAAFPAGLIALACLIFVVSSAGVCFVCYKWNRYNVYKDQVQHVVLPPRSLPYSSHSNISYSKQYETQVLNMRVSEIDIDDSDLQVDLDLSRNHVYNSDQAPVMRTFQKAESIVNPIYERSDDDDVSLTSHDQFKEYRGQPRTEL